MNIFKRVIIFLVLVFCLFFNFKLSVFALDKNYNDKYSNYDYYIPNYSVDIVVNKDNSFDITENISVYFNKGKHGIVRSIPLKNKIFRYGFYNTKNNVEISNVFVNSEYSTFNNNNLYDIKIGSYDKILTGSMNYVISYKYDIGNDPLLFSDEFYFNIIGHEWDTLIDSVDFSIKMPKNFDSDKIKFFVGKWGSIGNKGLTYTVKNNVIKGSYKNGLDKGYALTIKCNLPNGYFDGLEFNRHYLLYFLIPVICLIISFIIWIIKGKDKHIVKTVQFYPPEGLNSLEVGFLYKGYGDSKDVSSLLIDLANKGYLKISGYKYNDKLKEDDLKIIKLKEYDGNDVNEKIFIDGLFDKKSCDKSLTKDEVLLSDLYDRFYKVNDKIIKNINDKKNLASLYNELNFNNYLFIFLMIISCFIMISYFPLKGLSPFKIICGIIYPGVFFIVTAFIGFNSLSSFTKIFKNKFWGYFKIILLCFILWLCFGFFFVVPSLLNNVFYFYGYFSGLLCILGMIICCVNLPKRTDYFNDIYGKIIGFRDYLKYVEVDKLNELVYENPNYFYDILPYVYVLGLSDEWIGKFELMNLKEPDWYDSSNNFNFKSTLSCFEKNGSCMMSYNHNSYSSSGFSGGGGHSSGHSSGGFSGGGSGGGGGHSW